MPELGVAQAIVERRSIKYFDDAYVLGRSEEQALLDAARHAPTAFNIQNWRFVLVRDPLLRAKIRKAAWDQPQVSDCSLLMVLCFDLLAHERQPARYWRDAPAEIQDLMVTEIQDFYRDDTQLQRDEGMRSCGIAAGSIMLQAKALGLDSCAMDGFDFKRVGHLINLPPEHDICMMIAIGKAARPAQPRSGPLATSEIFFENRFAEPPGH